MHVGLGNQVVHFSSSHHADANRSRHEQLVQKQAQRERERAAEAAAAAALSQQVAQTKAEEVMSQSMTDHMQAVLTVAGQSLNVDYMASHKRSGLSFCHPLLLNHLRMQAAKAADLKKRNQEHMSFLQHQINLNKSRSTSQRAKEEQVHLCGSGHHALDRLSSAFQDNCQ